MIESMFRHDTWLSRDDIQGIDELRSEVLRASRAPEDELGTIHGRIGEILLGNITRLGLDDDLIQILAVANRISGELLSPNISRLHYPGGIWAQGMTGALRPFQRRSDPPASSSPELIPAKQAIAMTHVLAHLVQLDPLLADGGKALLEHERAHNLMPPEDSIDDIDV